MIMIRTRDLLVRRGRIRYPSFRRNDLLPLQTTMDHHTLLLSTNRKLSLCSYHYSSLLSAVPPSSSVGHSAHNSHRIRSQGVTLFWSRAITTTGGITDNNNDHHHSKSKSSGSRIIAGYIAEEEGVESKNDTEGEASSNDARRSNTDNYTSHQRNLLEYTKSILPNTNTYPPGTLSYTQIIQISNCIDQWISSGEHRYLGAEQAELLMKRLIVERGGGRSLLLTNSDDNEINDGQNIEKLRRNDEVTWEMYHLHSVMHYLNALYTDSEFVDRILSIVDTFENEYVKDVIYDHDLELPYKSIISSLCNLRTPHAATAAEHVLHRFESVLKSNHGDGDDDASVSDAPADFFVHSNPPTMETYNSIISCWKRSDQHVQYPAPPPYCHNPNPCSNLLCQMLELYNANPSTMARMKPDFLSFNMAISSLSLEQIDNVWRNRGNYNNANYIGKMCYEHLMAMLGYFNDGDERCAPDLITFSAVLNALGRGKDHRDEQRAREVLDVMLHLNGIDLDGKQNHPSKFDVDVMPRNKHFNVVLALMAGKQRVDAKALECAKRYVGIMKILEKREEDRAAGVGGESQDMPRPLRLYDNDLLGGIDNPPLGEDDETAIMSMTQSAPDTITYNTLLSVAARAGRPMEAEQILEDMISQSLNNEKSLVRPDRISFNTVLLAWSKSKSSEGKLRMEKILHRMQKMADNGDADVRPDRTSLTTVINAIVSSGRRDRMAPIHAARIIERMETNKDSSMRPDVVTYTSLIKCWVESGSKRAAERAEEIMNTLHQRYNDGYDECKPDTKLYNVAMNAIAKSDAPQSAERAEALLNRLLDCYYAGDSDLTPTTQSFSAAILAWARSNDHRGALKAEKLLQTMHDLEKSGVGNVSPNTITYSTCILAWRNSRHSDAGKRAESLLNKMERYESKGMYNLKPNAITYTNAMDAWIGARQPDSLEKVESILKRMVDRSKGGDHDSAPTTTTYNVVMKAIRHSSHPKKYQEAQDLLNQMKRLHEKGDQKVKPNINTYNTFFSACAGTVGDTEDRTSAFSLVLSALIEVQDNDNLRADAYTWPAVWKACENLLDVKRDLAWINHIFELTVKSGYVNELLFNNMRKMLPPQYLQKKLKTKDDVQLWTVHELPPDWTRNAKLQRDRRQQKRRTFNELRV